MSFISHSVPKRMPKITAIIMQIANKDLNTLLRRRDIHKLPFAMVPFGGATYLDGDCGILRRQKNIGAEKTNIATIPVDHLGHIGP
jgi:hypothetical protein